MSLRKYIVGQFRHPTGSIGKLAGWIMANRGSNIRRNLFTVDALSINPEDYVLEIGCGPGVALTEVLKKINGGKLVGLDHSKEMIVQSRKSCLPAVSDGTLELWIEQFETCQIEDQYFDKVFCVNVIQFFRDQKEAIEKIYRILARNGAAAVTYMPRTKRPSRLQALEMAEKVRKLMVDVGFLEIEILEYSCTPVPSVTVIGKKLTQPQ
ncbi:class I SAM-dependent methyltransferase [Pseudemcibacter aquimaris]|uniref:class I SAM-dependent methyltransferase n=1 Tax=Pseudemcibacter aquimaris TaxID=2857064 RepID=UPI002012F17D|nr:class I SAM-dependent methyltransferase [Pseudemcibacter aquimaris]MCC3859930.1 class I SAM-dependent methyltransferase [Pseudemcibacter aquimaris]WDU57262.1 class I SAM-dependent methyltransferase [Pseudemcibacter aquimaris]